MIPVISFVGRHNSGKTTVLSGVVNYLSSAGLKVALIKHVHHSLDIEPIKDAEKLFLSGAAFVLASSPGVSLQYCRQEQELSLAEIMTEVPESIDLIIVEGFKTEALAKIEVLRYDIDPVPMLLPETIAVVNDFGMESDLQQFNHNQIREIAKYILHILAIKLPAEK